MCKLLLPQKSRMRETWLAQTFSLHAGAEPIKGRNFLIISSDQHCLFE